VCWGTLKGENQTAKPRMHSWVMNIATNFEDVIFWDPMNNRKYTLKKRVMHPDLLKKFLKGRYEREEEILKDILLKNKKPQTRFADKKSNIIII